MDQKGRVWVTTKYDTKRRRAVVTVADEGPGIAPEDQEKLFVPYFTQEEDGNRVRTGDCAAYHHGS